MDTARMIEVALLSLVAGALLPVLWQLFAMARSARIAVEREMARIDATMTTLQALAERVNRLTAPLEEQGRVDKLVRGVDDLSAILAQVHDVSRVAAAVGAAAGPAVVAGFHAWRTASAAASASSNGTGGEVEDPQG